MLHRITAAQPNVEAERKPKVTTNKDIALMPPGRWGVPGEPGLYLFVGGDGQVRRWLFRYTSPITRKVTEAGLDAVSAVSLAQAKIKAGAMRRQIAAGVDPIHAKRTERSSAVTFGDVCAAWIEVHKASWKGGDTGSQMKSAQLVLHHHGAPLAKVAVADVTPDHIQAALEKLWKRAPSQGKRSLGMFARVLDYAKAKGFRVGDNPASWRGMHEYRFARRRAEDRGHHSALPYEQMPEFMRALRQRQKMRQGTGAVALEFTILTCVRTSEALGATWEEIDFEKHLWTVPKERMKTGKDHQVPLSDRAIEVLRQQKRRAPGEYVFTAYGRKARLADRCMRSALHHLKADCTVHGFRSTFRDWCGDTTLFTREHVEACLAHRVGNSVEQAYRRQTALEKRRVIMDAWAAYCEGSTPTPPSLPPI
jgi:integrase